MPEMPCKRSPHNPVRSAGRTGTPPATEAPNANWQPWALASCSRSGPWRAISCLFAVTTHLPATNALRTNSSAGCKPPTSSITMSASELRISPKSSVQTTLSGTQGCFLRSTLRLQIWVSRSKPTLRSARILATHRPTVPKPTSATRHGAERCREGGSDLAFLGRDDGILRKTRSQSIEIHFYHTWRFLTAELESGCKRHIGSSELNTYLRSTNLTTF